MKISSFCLYLSVWVIFLERPHLFIINHGHFLKQFSIRGVLPPLSMHRSVDIIPFELNGAFRKIILIQVVQFAILVALPDLDFAIRVIEFADTILLPLVQQPFLHQDAGGVCFGVRPMMLIGPGVMQIGGYKSQIRICFYDGLAF